MTGWMVVVFVRVPQSAIFSKQTVVVVVSCFRPRTQD